MNKTYFEKVKEEMEIKVFLYPYFKWIKYIVFIFIVIYCFYIGYGIYDFSIVLGRAFGYAFSYVLIGFLPVLVFFSIIIKCNTITVFVRIVAISIYSLVFFLNYHINTNLKYVYENYKYYQPNDMTVGLIEDYVKFEPTVFEVGHGRTVVVEDIPYIISLGENQKTALMCSIGKHYWIPVCPLISNPEYIHKPYHIRYKMIETDKYPIKLLVEIIDDKKYTQDFFINFYQKQLQEILILLLFYIIVWFVGCIRIAIYQKK